VIKYLVIAVLVSIIFVLVYTRIRPYLQIIQKIVQSLNVVTDIKTPITSNQKIPSRNKLIRCDRCGTWIPAERAVDTFCSSECKELIDVNLRSEARSLHEPHDRYR